MNNNKELIKLFMSFVLAFIIMFVALINQAQTLIMRKQQLHEEALKFGRQKVNLKKYLQQVGVIKLNRAERRRLQRETAKDPTYNINQKQLSNLVHDKIEDRLGEIQSEAISKTIRAYTAAWVISLHDEFNFGHKRLQRILDKVQNQFECVTAETVTIEDLVNWCEEYGIEIK